MPTLQMYKVELKACLRNRRRNPFWYFEDGRFHVSVVACHTPVAPLGLRRVTFRRYYTPFAPPGLLEARAQGISIALLNQSVDRTLQTVLFKQALSRLPKFIRLQHTEYVYCFGIAS